MNPAGTSRPTRRTAVAMLAAGSVAALLPGHVRSQARPRLVVVGGGAGGASIAKHAARDSKRAIDVTLVEERESFVSCFFSNHYVAGLRDFASITHGYSTLESSYGIRKVTGRAVAIDRDEKVVVLFDGARIPYDRLVLSPGIDIIYDSVPDYSAGASKFAPHAWIAGEQTKLLKNRLDALEDGQDIVIVVPPNPYRCPPGPYERASMLAMVLKARGLSRSKIFILDHKEQFSKQALFQEGWSTLYPRMIEWYGPAVHGGVLGMDAQAGKVVTGLGEFEGGLLNIIPAQRAGAIAAEAGLTDTSGFCPVEADSMRSRIDAGVFIVGDASIAGDMPKSAFSANSQAKVAAAHIIADLLGTKAGPAAYANTCWSMIGPDDSVKVGGRYEPKDGKIAAVETFISKTGEVAALRAENVLDSLRWYDGIVADAFT